MWDNYMKYRVAYKIDTIMVDPNDARAPKLREVYPTGYCGVAKNGWPIYIERNGLVDVNEVYKLFPQDEVPEDQIQPMMRVFARSYEDLQRWIMMACSHAQGR